MGKSEIIKKLAKKLYGNTSPKEIQQCTEFCDTLANIITEALLKNEKILWKDFLSMEVVERPERKGRNPQTGEVATFPPSKSVVCKVSKSIKNLIKGT